MVEMVRKKNVSLLAISLESIPINLGMTQTYELQANQLKKEEIKELNLEKIDTSIELDQLLEQYPILDKIVEKLLKYVYNWMMVVTSSFK